MYFLNRFTGLVLIGLALVYSQVTPLDAAVTCGPSLVEGMVAQSREGAAIGVRELIDPENPYLGQYGERDYWVLAHNAPELDIAEMQKYSPNVHYPAGEEPDRSDRPEGWTTLRGMVDGHGFLVPNGLMPAGWPERQAGGKVIDAMDRFRHRQQQEYPTVYYVNAAGVLSPGKLKQFADAATCRKAADYPLVPAWLGEQPPLFTMFIPNGEIVAFGALGVELINAPPTPGRGWNRIGRWYHLGPEGKLLGQTGLVREHSNSWFSFFFADYDEVYLGWKEKSNYTSNHTGAVLFGEMDHSVSYSHLLPERPAPTLLAAFTYDGQPLGFEDELPDYGQNYLTSIRGSLLHQIYLGQVELGLVDPVATASDLVGQPGGAVVYNPADAGTGVYASSQSRQQDTFVEVRHLDDPDSPYAGQYAAWDHFVFENIGQSNPESQKRFQAQNNERTEKIAALAKEGKEVPAEIWQPQGVPVDPNDPWKHIEAQVDAGGYMIPLVLQQQNEQLMPLYLRQVAGGQTQQTFRLNSGGIMPEEMEQAYLQAMFAARMDHLPGIPTWLSANPVHSAIPCPGGDWVTRGELGSWVDYVDAPRKEQGKQYLRLELHRYSADGELLEVGARFEQFWQRFYSPAAAAILDGVNNSQGVLGASSQNSFIRVYTLDPSCADGG